MSRAPSPPRSPGPSPSSLSPSPSSMSPSAVSRVAPVATAAAPAAAARRATPAARAPWDAAATARTASWWLLVAGLTAYMTLSSSVLYELGVPYDTPGGGFAVKIHPGTYLVALSWWLGAVGQGNPLAVALRQARQHRLPALSLVCMAAVFAWAAAQHGPGGLAFIVDTLCMPAVALLALLLHPRRRHRWLLQWLLALLLANALLGIAESATRTRLVPIFGHLSGYIAEPFFRASALMGHPLTNALVTASLLPAVLATPWRAAAKAAALAVLALALLAFGGRTAMAAALVYPLLGAGCALWLAVNGRLRYTQLTGGVLGVVLAVSLLAGVAAASGIGERIFKSLVWDNSAAVRLRVWDALDHVHGPEAWFGMSMASIDRIAARIGIDPRYEAIENYWLYLLLLLGALGFVLFCAGLALLLAHLWRHSRAPLRLGLAVFLLVSSTANTLSAKSIALVLLAVTVQCAAAARAGAARPSPFPSWAAPRLSARRALR